MKPSICTVCFLPLYDADAFGNIQLLQNAVVKTE